MENSIHIFVCNFKKQYFDCYTLFVDWTQRTDRNGLSPHDPSVSNLAFPVAVGNAWALYFLTSIFTPPLAIRWLCNAFIFASSTPFPVQVHIIMAQSNDNIYGWVILKPCIFRSNMTKKLSIRNFVQNNYQLYYHGINANVVLSDRGNEKPDAYYNVKM